MRVRLGSTGAVLVFEPGVNRSTETVMADQEFHSESNEGAAPNRRDGSAVPKHEQSKGTAEVGSQPKGRDEPPPAARRSEDSPWMGGG